MIKLLNIRRNNDTIRCDVRVEDCSTLVPISIDEKNGTVEREALPKGYEYCTTHIGYAERFLKTIIGQKTLPSEKLIMWY